MENEAYPTRYVSHFQENDAEKSSETPCRATAYRHDSPRFDGRVSPMLHLLLMKFKGSHTSSVIELEVADVAQPMAASG